MTLATMSRVFGEPFNWPCRFALHTWDLWEVIHVEWHRTSDGQQIVGRTLLQERRCKACGLYEQTSHSRYIV